MPYTQLLQCNRPNGRPRISSHGPGYPSIACKDDWYYWDDVPSGGAYVQAVRCRRTAKWEKEMDTLFWECHRTRFPGQSQWVRPDVVRGRECGMCKYLHGNNVRWRTVESHARSSNTLWFDLQFPLVCEDFDRELATSLVFVWCCKFLFRFYSWTRLTYSRKNSPAHHLVITSPTMRVVTITT